MQCSADHTHDQVIIIIVIPIVIILSSRYLMSLHHALDLCSDGLRTSARSIVGHVQIERGHQLHHKTFCYQIVQSYPESHDLSLHVQIAVH